MDDRVLATDGVDLQSAQIDGLPRAQPAGAVASNCTGSAQAGPWQAPQASAGSLATAGEAWGWVVLTGAFLDSCLPLKTLMSV